jgi:ferric-dicitrate binding protein FerR (iron transport regulator)
MSDAIAQREGRLVELVRAYVEGACAADAMAELESRLAADAEARAYFLRHVHVDAALRWEYAGSADRSAGQSTGADALASTRSLRPRPYLIAAALLLLAACGFAIYALALNPQSAIPDPQSPTTVASVLDVSDHATLLIDGTIADAGVDYLGRSVSLDSGEAQFMLPNQVSVKLRGKTSLTIRDAMHVAMTHGTAEFECPPRAKGYTVHAPGGVRVVDLGTRFGVQVGADGRVRVRVLEGSVVLRTAEGADRVLIVGQIVALIDGRIEAPPADLSPIDVGFEQSAPGSFAVSDSDLLQTAVEAHELAGPAVETGVFVGQHVRSLTNAPGVWHPDHRQTIESWSTHDGGSITWRLDTDAAMFGYEIDRVVAIAGCWPSRTGHVYAIEVSTIESEGFVPLCEVVRPDDVAHSSGIYESRSIVARRGGEPLATGVDAIRFIFRDDSPQGRSLGQSVYREIDVIGRPVGDAEPAATDERSPGENESR